MLRKQEYISKQREKEIEQMKKQKLMVRFWIITMYFLKSIINYTDNVVYDFFCEYS